MSCSSLDTAICVWNVNTGRCEKVLTGHDNGVLSLFALPDGRLVSWSSDKTMRVWNVITGYCETVLIGHEHVVESVIELPDGRLISRDDSGGCRLWSKIIKDGFLKIISVFVRLWSPG